MAKNNKTVNAPGGPAKVFGMTNTAYQGNQKASPRSVDVPVNVSMTNDIEFDVEVIAEKQQELYSRITTDGENNDPYDIPEEFLVESQRLSKEIKMNDKEWEHRYLPLEKINDWTKRRMDFFNQDDQVVQADKDYREMTMVEFHKEREKRQKLLEKNIHMISDLLENDKDLSDKIHQIASSISQAYNNSSYIKQSELLTGTPQDQYHIIATNNYNRKKVNKKKADNMNPYPPTIAENNEYAPMNIGEIMGKEKGYRTISSALNMTGEEQNKYLNTELKKAEEDTDNIITRLRNNARIISNNPQKAVHNDYAKMMGTLTEYFYLKSYRDNLREITY